MGDLLEDGDAGLVIVAVNPKDADVDARLANAVPKVVKDDVADTPHALERAFDAVDEELTGRRERPIFGQARRWLAGVSSCPEHCPADPTPNAPGRLSDAGSIASTGRDRRWTIRRATLG